MDAPQRFSLGRNWVSPASSPRARPHRRHGYRSMPHLGFALITCLRPAGRRTVGASQGGVPAEARILSPPDEAAPSTRARSLRDGPAPPTRSPPARQEAPRGPRDEKAAASGASPAGRRRGWGVWRTRAPGDPLPDGALPPLIWPSLPKAPSAAPTGAGLLWRQWVPCPRAAPQLGGALPRRPQGCLRKSGRLLRRVDVAQVRTAGPQVLKEWGPRIFPVTPSRSSALAGLLSTSPGGLNPGSSAALNPCP